MRKWADLMCSLWQNVTKPFKLSFENLFHQAYHFSNKSSQDDQCEQGNATLGPKSDHRQQESKVEKKKILLLKRKNGITKLKMRLYASLLGLKNKIKILQ